jgi:putative ABC transport system ATP-binding protein/lipoprotein-releasing system ATP-binding protein
MSIASATQHGPPILVAEGIHQSFTLARASIHVLRGVSLTIHTRSIAFIQGSSGGGKSTLLYALAGLERPDAGSVRFRDRSLYDDPSVKLAAIRNRCFGFVFQAYHLLPELTALENVLLPAMIGGLDAKKKANDLLSRVGLGDRLSHMPYELSGGEQQRVAIARALINDPEFIFADEPTGNLDSKTGGAVMDLLTELVRETGKTMLVVTHDRTLATRGDFLFEMRDGEIVS